MNCYFCQCPMPPLSSKELGISCQQCNAFHVSGNNSFYMVCLYHLDYTLALVINENTSFILKNHKYIAKMDYIPDVNLNNYVKYIEKILKLKLFL